MAGTTLGVKVDESLRERLRRAADRLGCTPHWLHKQALLGAIERIERGEQVADLVPTSGLDDRDARPQTVEAFDTVPFFDFCQDVQPQTVLRAAITSVWRRPEPECVPALIAQARHDRESQTAALALRLVRALRAKKKGTGVEALIQEFSLSTQEGVALMCLAEALLRIPDRSTRDALIRDKISKGDWKSHLGASPSMFVNAATWGLVLTGELVSASSESRLSRAVTRLIGKGGEPVIRQGVNMAMRMMGEQFVTGQTIAEALANSAALQARGFRYSYDMLGEAAVTREDAHRYFKLYEQAIHAIGKASARKGIYAGAGISVKLSALHPRYARAQRDRVMGELLRDLTELCRLARHYEIGLNIDAEESDRLELSLDLLEALCLDPGLADWNGIGFVVQAYQKRAPGVIDYLVDLARRSGRRLMVRLVKGAYWDSEIKHAQVDGLEGYPVFTRKVYTDVSYLACARRLLAAPQAVYPQFATHNAYCVAAIYEMAGPDFYPEQYEFQCLHGMGEPLYEEVTGPIALGKLGRPCRIYAPVGTHETLLAYLVRRLLENGSNSSFVNQINDPDISTEDLIANPAQAASLIDPIGRPHDRIPLPRDLFDGTPAGGRLNSVGLDLCNEQRLASLTGALLQGVRTDWRAAPMLAGSQGPWDETRASAMLNPADHRDRVGFVMASDASDVRFAIAQAESSAPIWQSTPPSERALCLLRAADGLEAAQQPLVGLLIREAGKTFPNAVGEIREAVDFLRFYASQAAQTLSNDTDRALGVVACISPWNFPLAIFTGQIAAALAAGNTVLAKPAEQTPLVAAAAVRMLHEAGVPAGALQLLPGDGETIGAALAASNRVQAVVFTGSTEVARTINRQISGRLDDWGNPVTLIAETGGLNAMVVDSSALAEQVVADALVSAFDSAGQRCSALRLLCLQEESADRVLEMLRGAMRELQVGNPDRLSTDIGPVIDETARQRLLEHIENMRRAGRPVTQSPRSSSCQHGTFVVPTLIEIDSVDAIGGEVFGPVLHVIRYRREQLGALVDAINATGYALTFGVHSRIDETIGQLAGRTHAGNVYVNRNMVGAVVGVQPFGGGGLSGTGPKAGGPLYLGRLLATRPNRMPAWVCEQSGWPREQSLPGPTGESNIYRLAPRGQVLCSAITTAGVEAQWSALTQTGNRAVWLDHPCVREWLARGHGATNQHVLVSGEHPERDAQAMGCDAALFEGDADALQAFCARLALRTGPIVTVQGRSTDALQAGNGYMLDRLLSERSISVNTAAAGGNASLMTIG